MLNILKFTYNLNHIENLFYNQLKGESIIIGIQESIDRGLPIFFWLGVKFKNIIFHSAGSLFSKLWPFFYIVSDRMLIE